MALSGVDVHAGMPIELVVPEQQSDDPSIHKIILIALAILVIGVASGGLGYAAFGVAGCFAGVVLCGASLVAFLALREVCCISQLSPDADLEVLSEEFDEATLEVSEPAPISLVGEGEVIVDELSVPEVPVHTNVFPEVNQHQKKQIRFVITSLATKNMFQLGWITSDLMQAGEDTKPVHPLNYLKCVLKDNSLKNHIHIIHQGGGIQWNSLFNGLAENLGKAFTQNTLTEAHIREFADEVEIEVELIHTSLKKRQWKQFMDTLLENVP